MGHFVCRNDTCPRPGWGSKVVAIHIREYHNSGYNVVVYGQRCNKCNRFGDLTLHEASYVDRVSYRVMKWTGVPMPRRGHGGVKSKAPHEEDLCEGCKRGHCPWSNSNNAGFSD
ncbi:zinc-binding domain-containing protein [Schizothecium vesticola]|uniref:Zinc-binding domain-containing protein n=1 Tax=Schizothecium vesticola TaxID=314040 RepID=A0AA40K2X8_9PEZI|nr:zinc-binding domain-containing protein [Schizothecium vesticola]